VAAVATLPKWNYEGVIWECDYGTADGRTGIDQSFVDLELTFSGNCNIHGLEATVTSSATRRSTQASISAPPALGPRCVARQEEASISRRRTT
jgi:hypothetical protein